MEKWLHPDLLFVVDYEMETRREWLKETEWLFELEDYFSIPNFKLLYEDKNVVVYQGKYIMDVVERAPVSTTDSRDGRPWRQSVNRLAVG